jgi:hypothetical protein
VTSRAPRGERVPGAALAAILAVALVARLWGIRYGLPWLFYFHDEPQVVLRALRFGTGDLNPHFFIWPAIPLLDLAFLSYVALFVTGRVLGWWAGKTGFAAAYFRDPTPFYLLPRLQSVGFGLWGVWLANGAGAAAYGAPVGIAAALGLAVNALHAHYSHLAHPVTAMTAFTVLGLWSAVRLATDGGRREQVLGAMALGVGTACQYHAAMLVVPLGVAVMLRSVREPRDAGRWIARGAGIAIGGAAVFLLLAPYTLLDYPTFRADLAWITAKTAGAAGSVMPGPLGGLVAFTQTCLVPGLGLPLAIAAGLGALVAIMRRTRADLVLLSFTLAYLALASRAVVLNDRYAIPLVVPALAFAGRLVWGVAWRLPRSVPARVALPALAILVLSLPVVLELIETDFTMTRVDTRIEALRWFESHVPADQRVVLDMLRFWNTATAPLAENRTRLEERIAEITRGVSGGGASAAYLDYYRYRLEHPVAPAYYLRGTDMGTAAEPLAVYRAQGFQWAMVNGDLADAWRGRPAPADSSGPAFYRGLDREATRVAVFRPERWRRRGPVITIYRLDTPPR